MSETALVFWYACRHFLMVLMLYAFVGTVPLSAQDPSDALVTLNQAHEHLAAGAFEEALAAANSAAAQLAIPEAGQVKTLDLTADLAVRNTLLYRALAAEQLGQYIEAQSDYLAFLSIENRGPRADATQDRLAFVGAEATRAYTQRSAEDRPELETVDRLKIGVFPFVNLSEIGLMKQFGFAVAGFINNTLPLLSDFTNMSFRTADRAQVAVALQELTFDRLYGTSSDVTNSELGYMLGSGFVVTGTVNEVVGSLIAKPIFSRTADGTTEELAPVQSPLSAYSSEGTRRLQLELVLRVADRLQELTGFTYTRSRNALADSVDKLVYGDVNAFLAYGAGYESMLFGRYAEANRIFSETEAATSPIAEMDRVAIREMLRATRQPDADLTVFLDSLMTDPVLDTPPDPVAETDPQPNTPENNDDPEPIDPVVETPPDTDPEPRPVRTPPVVSTRSLSLLSQMGLSALGAAAISDVVTGTGTPEQGNEDPREGKPGTLDPTRQVQNRTIRIIAPLPPNTQQNGKKQ